MRYERHFFTELGGHRPNGMRTLCTSHPLNHPASLCWQRYGVQQPVTTAVSDAIRNKDAA